MFNRLVISGANGIKTNKPWTVALSASVEGLVVIQDHVPFDDGFTADSLLTARQVGKTEE